MFAACSSPAGIVKVSKKQAHGSQGGKNEWARYSKEASGDITLLRDAGLVAWPLLHSGFNVCEQDKA